MIRRLALLLAALLSAVAASAADAPPLTRVPPSRTVAQLPSAPPMPRLYGITDGASATDCATGGGSVYVLCFWNGSAWTAVGAGGGGDLADLGDVDVTGAATNSPLVYNGSDTWIDGTHVAASSTAIDQDGDGKAEVSADGTSVLIDANDDGSATMLISESAFKKTDSSPIYFYFASTNLRGQVDNSAGVCSVGGGFTYGCLQPVVPSTTVPSVVPSWANDSTTGLGRDSTSGGLSLIDASTEVARAHFSTVGVLRVYDSIFLAPRSTPPVTCAAGEAGRTYYDSDLNLLCTCNGTNWLQQDDWATTCS